MFDLLLHVQSLPTHVMDPEAITGIFKRTDLA